MFYNNVINHLSTLASIILTINRDISSSKNHFIKKQTMYFEQKCKGITVLSEYCSMSGFPGIDDKFGL